MKKLICTEKPIIINHPDDKFETHIFLPEGDGRKGEGGLRTRGYFKFSYKLMEDGLWYMCDLDGTSVKPASEDIQRNIRDFIRDLKERNPDLNCFVRKIIFWVYIQPLQNLGLTL